MSSAINVYAVPIERLTQVVGSRDRAIIDAIITSHTDFLSSIDDIDDEAPATCAQAIAGLVNGETSGDVPPYLYGYALEAICGHIGEELPNICPIARGSDWIEEIDGVLESKNVPVRLNMLVYAGSPVRIPEPDDYPFIGRWEADKIPASLAALRSLKLSDLDREMAETLAQMQDWLERAAKMPGVSVIGFLS